MSSGSGSSSSSSSNDEEVDDPGQDEAGSDPPSSEEQQVQADSQPPATNTQQGVTATAPRAALQRCTKPLKSNMNAKRMKGSKRRQTVADVAFALDMEALQGRWRHSSSNLGLLTVKDDCVRFDSGLTYQIKQPIPGIFDVAGWKSIASKSTPEEIFWQLGQLVVSWQLEDDADRPADEEGIDVRNIIEGKRRRTQVDYKALEKQLDLEEQAGKDIYSDDSDEDPRTTGRAVAKRSSVRSSHEAIETMSPQEWSALHQARCGKAMELFHKWMLSTCTERHDELLRRKGKLVTRLPVEIVKAGQTMLQKELSGYSVKVAFREQETVIIVDDAARKRYEERHRSEWQTHRQKSSGGGHDVRPTQQLSSPIATSCVVAEHGAPNSQKRRKVRRIVTESDDEAQQGDGANPSTESASQAVPEEIESSVQEPLVDGPKTIEEAKLKLEATPKPSPEEVLNILAFLEKEEVDAVILSVTKIGATVNHLRKSYPQNADLVARSAELVARWRILWQQKAQQKLQK